MEDKLLKCKNELEVKEYTTKFLGEGGWEKLSYNLLESFFLKNWENKNGMEGVEKELSNFEVENNIDASILATIQSKFNIGDITIVDPKKPTD